jgi:hypothetical protein
MKLASKRTWRWFGWSLLVLLVGGAAAPFFEADMFRGKVRAALERSLQRRVEVGSVHLNVFRGPGFSVEKVIIHEDPRIGIEPFAYVTKLDARVSFWKLLAGRLEFSNLRLVEPSVNVARSQTNSWNVAPLLARAAGSFLPHLQVSGGRINFRSGERKSVFYVSSADLALSPASDGFDVSFSGGPARTDRSARGFGSFRGNLHWRPKQPASRQIFLDLEVEPSAIAEIMMLLQGHDVGLHGLLSARTTIEGSMERLKIRGQARIGDIHRWDLMAEHGRGWSLPYTGVLDTQAGTLELTTPVIAGGVQLRVRAADVFGTPKGGAHLIFRNSPAAPLLSTARHVGLRLPDSASASGGAFGVVSYSFPGRLQGRVQLNGAVLEVPDAPPVRFERADVLLDQGRLELAPALAEIGAGRAILEASYDTATAEAMVRIATRELEIDQFKEELGKFVENADIPMFKIAAGGSWSGSLSYKAANNTAGAWSGSLLVRKTLLDVQGIAGPVKVDSAVVAIDGHRLQVSNLNARAGDVAFTGEYAYEPSFARPHRFQLRVAELTGAQLEKLLAPALNRRQGFLARTLRMGQASLPGWLRDRRASGTVLVNAFDVAGMDLAGVRSRVVWDGSSVDLLDVEGRWKDSPVSLSGSVDLAAAGPVYALQWRVSNYGWNGGRVDLDGLLRTAGMGSELLNGMRAEGSFSGRSISLQNESFRAVSGCFAIVLDRGAPKLKLSGVSALYGQESLSGDGASQPDGLIQMELAGARSLVRLAGTAWPFELEPVSLR